jgi:hypothetical protein
MGIELFDILAKNAPNCSYDKRLLEVKMIFVSMINHQSNLQAVQKRG